MLVSVTVCADLAGNRRPVHGHAEFDVALFPGLLGPCFDNKRNLRLRALAADERMAVLDCVFVFGEGIATDAAKPLRAHFTSSCVRDLQQRLRLVAIDALTGRAIELGDGNDLPGLAPAAPVELRDQTAQRA